MRALILAAGLGSRLQHKTASIPKAMVSVDRMPIISHQIKALIENNIYEVAVVLGYKANILKEYLLKNHSNIKFSFFLNRHYKKSNSAYSFFIGSDYIKDEQYIHLNCDILFSSELLRNIINSDKDNVVAVNLNENVSDNMELVNINDLNKIVFMDNTFFKGAMGKAYGLAKFSSDSSNFILNKIGMYHDAGDFNQNYYGIIRQALNDIDYYCQDCGELLLSEVNSLKDFDSFQKRFSILKNDEKI